MYTIVCLKRPGEEAADLYFVGRTDTGTLVWTSPADGAWCTPVEELAKACCKELTAPDAVHLPPEVIWVEENFPP